MHTIVFAHKCLSAQLSCTHLSYTQLSIHTIVCTQLSYTQLSYTQSSCSQMFDQNIEKKGNFVFWKTLFLDFVNYILRWTSNVIYTVSWQTMIGHMTFFKGYFWGCIWSIYSSNAGILQPRNTLDSYMV